MIPQYSENAVKQLKKIAKSNKKSALLIIKTIEKYAENPGIKNDVKMLKGKFENLKRLRCGNYRIIFDEDLKIMQIFQIKHRQEVYND